MSDMSKDHHTRVIELLDFAVQQKASDLHLSSGLPPMFRVDGELVLFDYPAIEHQDVVGMIESVMNDKQRENYHEKLETDLSFENRALA